MIDQQLLRKDIHLIAQRLATRGFNLDQTAYNLLENSRKQLQARTEELQARRNQLSKAIGMKKSKGEDVTQEMADSVGVNEELVTSAAQLSQLQSDLQQFILGIPNIPHDSVPLGKDEHDNQEIKRWGEIPVFDFEFI